MNNIVQYENYNAAGDDASIQLDDVDHNDVDFEHELLDNNDMHPEMNNERFDNVRVHRATADHLSSSNKSATYHRATEVVLWSYFHQISLAVRA